MSANWGVAPTYKAQLALATNVLGVVMTLSPGPTLAARQARCNAAVPLDTATAYFAPTYRATAFLEFRNLRPLGQRPVAKYIDNGLNIGLVNVMAAVWNHASTGSRFRSACRSSALIHSVF